MQTVSYTGKGKLCKLRALPQTLLNSFIKFYFNCLLKFLLNSKIRGKEAVMIVVKNTDSSFVIEHNLNKYLHKLIEK